MTLDKPPSISSLSMSVEDTPNNLGRVNGFPMPPGPNGEISRDAPPPTTGT